MLNEMIYVLLLLSHFSRVWLLRPHRRQPTRLPHLWDSPGKNTGVGCHFLLQCMKVKSEREVAQSYPTLSNPIDCSLPGSFIHRIFQARIMEWVAISFSRVSSWPRNWTQVSHISGRLFIMGNLLWLYKEPRKMVLMNLFAELHWRQTLRTDLWTWLVGRMRECEVWRK